MTRGYPAPPPVTPGHTPAPPQPCLTQRALRSPRRRAGAGDGGLPRWVVGSSGCLLLSNDVDAVDDAGDVSAQLEQQRDQDLAAQTLLHGDRHRRQDKGDQDFQEVIMLLEETGSGTGVRGGTRQELPLR